MINTDDILSALYVKLQADTTLQGATYLNGTTKIYKGPKRAENFTNPTLTIVMITNPLEPYVKEQRAYYSINAFVDAHSDGTANTPTLGRIAHRVASLLDDVLPTRSGIGFKENAVTDILGPMETEAETPKGEFQMSVRGRLIAFST